jgi:hypothetical protein
MPVADAEPTSSGNRSRSEARDNQYALVEKNLWRKSKWARTDAPASAGPGDFLRHEHGTDANRAKESGEVGAVTGQRQQSDDHCYHHSHQKKSARVRTSKSNDDDASTLFTPSSRPFDQWYEPPLHHDAGSCARCYYLRSRSCNCCVGSGGGGSTGSGLG